MKASDPAGGAGFEFTGDLGDSILDDGESQTFSDLAEDDYDVTEFIPSGWDLRNVTCSGGDYDAIPGGVTIHLDPGEDVSCTYNNEISGSITIVKESFPPCFAGFGFTGDLGDFTLDDGQGQIFTDLPSGDYDITEILPSGWKLSEVICTGGDFDELTDGLTVHLGAAEDITCTFKNETIVNLYLPLIFANSSVPDTSQSETFPTNVVEHFLLEDILLLDPTKR